MSDLTAWRQDASPFGVTPLNIERHPIEPLGEIEQVAPHLWDARRVCERPHLPGDLAIIIGTRCWLVWHAILEAWIPPTGATPSPALLFQQGSGGAR
jgi:hypothetical protein